MIECPKHGPSIGTVCLSCRRDFAAQVWPTHARYWWKHRPNDPESFYKWERWNDLPSYPPVYNADTTVAP